MALMAYLVSCLNHSIASPLAKLFSLSLSTRKFPKMWKIASVVPIPKSKNKNDPSNYRPMSLLSVVSKLLEKIAYSVLWEHLFDHSPISDCQWDFQKHKSITTALLFTTQESLKFLDRKQEVICLYILPLQKKHLTVFRIGS